ncbi:MAG: META domain-containing protein [Gemmatimonadota bacterium]|nr:META domain-containing protein [Gemmatimonadota bacterium]
MSSLPSPFPRAVRLAVLSASAALSLSGCRVYDPTSPEELANRSYLAPSIESGVVTLVDGALDLPPGEPIERVELVASAAGDIDADEDPDAAVVLAEVLGDHTTYRLHAVVVEGERALDEATQVVGTAVRIEAVRIVDGIIEVDLAAPARSPGIDPAPVLITSKFALTTAGLVPIDPPETVPATAGRAAELEPGLDTHEWVLETMELGGGVERLSEVVELTTPPSVRFRIEVGDSDQGSGRMSGFGGCNRIFGGFAIEPDGSLSIVALGATRRACAEPLSGIESRITKSLTIADSYEIDGDRLTIHVWDGTLRFRAGAELAPSPDPGTGDPPEGQETSGPRRIT